MGFSGGGGSTSGLAKVASTPGTGFALQNATPNILTYTAPNDGNVHSVIVSSKAIAAGNPVGGGAYVRVNGSQPYCATTSSNAYMITPSPGNGVQYGMFEMTVQPGDIVTLDQIGALTAGTVQVYASIYAN